MADFSAELKKLLVAHGCELRRHGKGDHDIWYSLISGRKFPIDHKIKSRHTANGILRQAGLPKVF